MPTGTRPPGRPRNPEADETILRATLELLAEVGYRSLSMELVRARAGVGKATIYRRHAGKDDLVKAAVRHLGHELPVPPDSGSLLDDLQTLSDDRARALSGGGSLALVPRLLAEVAHDPQLRDIFHGHLVRPRRAVLRALLERAVERGEVSPDADLEAVMDLLMGSMTYQALLSGSEEASWPQRFAAGVRLVLRAVAP